MRVRRPTPRLAVQDTSFDHAARSIRAFQCLARLVDAETAVRICRRRTTMKRRSGPGADRQARRRAIARDGSGTADTTQRTYGQPHKTHRAIARAKRHNAVRSSTAHQRRCAGIGSMENLPVDWRFVFEKEQL